MNVDCNYLGSFHIPLQEIKSNVDSRTSILEALVEEGGILKENKNIEVDHPEEYSHIIELMVGCQYKWEVLNKNIDEKIARFVKSQIYTFNTVDCAKFPKSMRTIWVTTVKVP